MNWANKLECYITLGWIGFCKLQKNEVLLIQPHEPLLLLHCAGGLNVLLANIRLGRNFSKTSLNLFVTY
jgi:hypothetical protein